MGLSSNLLMQLPDEAFLLTCGTRMIGRTCYEYCKQFSRGHSSPMYLSRSNGAGCGLRRQSKHGMKRVSYPAELTGNQ